MTLLALSGWTQPADALHAVLPDALTFDYSDYAGFDAAIAAMKPYKDMETIVAWSMGGHLALRAMAAGVLAPKKLLLIAPPYQFVNDDVFSHGMTPDMFTIFRNNYAQDTQRTVDRFHGLIAKGHRDARLILKRLRHHHDIANTARWLPWLDALGRDSLSGMVIPVTGDVTLLHGATDAIVSVAQSEYIRALVPHARYEIWDNTGHAPHLDDEARFLGLLKVSHAG